MTPEQEMVEEIRMAIAALPNHQVETIASIANALRELIRRHDGDARLAIALVGAEEAAK